jgi:DNA-binding transcriptional LysR family regulator
LEYLLKEIDVFVKIIELGSFRAAADELNLTQSAMTQRLKRLEDALGVRLIERTTRSVSPTAVGRDFLPAAKRMILQFEQSMADLKDLIQAKTGQATVASLMSVATYILPAALSAFNKAHPNVSVRILDDVEREIAAYVRRGEAEFGIDMQTTAPEPGLRTTPLLEDRYVVACRAEHPLASRRSVSWAALTNVPLVTLGARSGTNQLLVSQLADAPRSSKWRFEVQHLPTLIGMVEEGVGVGIVPEMVMRARAADDLVQRRLVKPDLKRMIVLVERQGSELSPAAERLKAAILDTFRKLSAHSENCISTQPLPCAGG